jgi:hypothetical protein
VAGQVGLALHRLLLAGPGARHGRGQQGR